MSCIKIENISFSYKQRPNLICDISAEFEKGKMYAITGPSGCGKTTLLSLIGGMDIPQKGRIYYEEKLIDEGILEKHRRNNVSFVFQNYNLIDYLTAYENVELTAKHDAAEALRKVGFEENEIKRNVLKLSGGQQQRVAIARAIAAQTPVILADEPTGNLDENTALEIIALLKKLAETENKCVIVVTHSLVLAESAHKHMELRMGKLMIV